MNVVQDPSKKGSINSLLNPQDVSAFSSLPSGPLAPNHTHSQSHSTYYAPEYSPAGSFHLRAANWESSDDPARRKALDSGSMPRYPPQLTQSQLPEMHSQSSTSNYAYATSSGMMRDRMQESQEYAGDGHMWQHHTSQHDSMNMSYGRSIAPMYSDERAALSGGYRSSSINYPSGYDSQSGSGTGASQQWQTAERASVRLVARELSSQPTSSAQDERYTYYQQPRYDASVERHSPQQQQQQIDTTISSSHSQHPEPTRPFGPASSKRSHPDSEVNPAPKTKRPRAKAKATGSESSTPTPTGRTSKRGYNAKKRSEAAFISAQNALLRAQREGSQGHVQGTSSDSHSPSNPPTGDNGGVEQIYMPELQFARCMSNRYKNEEFPRCVSCTRRWAGDTCRFQGIRFFMRDAQKKLVGISFQEHPSVGPAPVMEFPSKWNRSFEQEHAKRSKLSIAKALLPTLKAEQEHIKSSEIVRRPRECDVRVTCDTCMTSLFSTSFMCRLCGREVCNECFQQVIDLTQTPTNPSSAEYAAFMARRERHAHANPFFLACLKRKDHAITEFTPVTRFVESELDQAIRDMEAILKKEEDILPSVDYPVNGPSNVNLPSTNQTYSAPEPGPSPDGPIESPPLQEQSSSDIRTEIPSTTLYAADTFPDPSIVPTYDDYTPSNVPEHITSIPIHRLQIIPASLYDPPQSTPSYSSKLPLVFSSLWVKGIPLLVKDVLPRFKLEWTPQYFMDRYGDQSCLIVECQTDENKRIDIREFFSKFGNYKDRQGCWKLKDWPPTAEFKKAFPDLFEDFSQAVPVPDYVRRDGVYNIGSHFPLNAIGPDLGPKMYNALASSQEVGSKGSTRLHMDMADALNVMLSATLCEDGTEGYAVWDLFRAEDSDKIRTFLKKKFGYGANGSTGSGSGGKKNANANGTAAAGSGGNAGEKTRATHAVPPVQMIGHDPIHGQQFYLDVELRRQLFEEFGVKSYRVYQRPGDGVFIPAGCAHQVANMADCMKIAIDFVSPENVDRCEKLTKEFREQNQSKAWKEDVLQLRTMMWFAWQSCTKMERTLDSMGLESSVPPLDTDRSSRR